MNESRERIYRAIILIQRHVFSSFPADRSIRRTLSEYLLNFFIDSEKKLGSLTAVFPQRIRTLVQTPKEIIQFLLMMLQNLRRFAFFSGGAEVTEQICHRIREPLKIRRKRA